MKISLGMAAALLATAAPVQFAAAAPIDLVKAAIAAEGGLDALKSLKSIVVKGTAKHWEPGQSVKAGGEPRFLGDTNFTLTVDLRNFAAKFDLDRSMVYPAVATVKYSEVVTPEMGFVTDDKGSKASSGMRVSAQLRELERASPLLMLAVLADPDKLGAASNQRVGKSVLPAVTFTDHGNKFTIMFDPKTHLPAAIRTRDDDNIFGDSNYDLVLADWKDVGGVKMPYSLSYMLDNIEVGHVTVTDATANPTIADNAFTPSDAVKAAAKAPLTGYVPYQWVLRRIALARFLDDDSIFYPTASPPKTVSLASNVAQVITGTANALIVNRKDGLAVFDAPYGEAESKYVIDQAKATFPGKPIKYLVLTHHHMDHTGGMRTYAAEGATIIVPAPDKAYFERDLRTTHTVLPDELQKHPRRVQVVEVKDEMTLKDSEAEIKIYRFDNPHVDGMLTMHVVQPNIVWVTDLWNPGTPAGKNPNSEAFAAELKKAGITGATLAGGHGANGKQSDLEAVMASQ